MLTKELLRELEEVVGSMNENGSKSNMIYELEVTKTLAVILKKPINKTLPGIVVVSVTLDELNKYFVRVTGDMNEPWKYMTVLSWALDRYAKTPIEDRDEKRYYVKVADGSFGYLNYRGGDYGVFEKDNELKKTKFTRSEIAKYLGTDDDKLLDMYIERFCEEVE